MFYGSFLLLFFILLVFLKSSQSTNFYDGYERLSYLGGNDKGIYLVYILLLFGRGCFFLLMLLSEMFCMS